MKEEQNIALQIKKLDIMIIRKVFESVKEQKEFNITHVQANILKFLAFTKNKKIYQTDIEKELNLRRSTISGVLNTMEKNNLIKRINCKSDARKKEIILTEKSLKKSKEMKEKFIKFNDLIKKNISKEDLDTFFNVLNKIKENLN